jgi:hypothetical protein
MLLDGWDIRSGSIRSDIVFGLKIAICKRDANMCLGVRKGEFDLLKGILLNCY